ncbi:Uma2 family endonuclease [Sphaerospermopsis torques-reginae]|uniref:Uma2 family endonuclease n=1 Tax=Sphaerospermopsis torques-reginae ITEP-024 TaxID=984208 RepID=A0ABX8WTP6_9CYAN|nr:Uma2 family endonuclease [Sphaerospermopsis torques-reginae]QYX29786.1 Uma2 family endonuclease [Sphaerospermopsis torques-reginae ITEP-024]
MTEQLLDKVDDHYIPDANLLITEDDTPVDNFPSAKQQRLLVSSLYSYSELQPCLIEANVGIYHTDGEPAIVPDVFISFDVQTPEEWWKKQNRCYMVWKFGKSPELVMEIVSNQEGEELTKKLKIYERMKVNYYLVYDPNQELGEEQLHIYQLVGRHYAKTSETWLSDINLGVTFWEGEFEGRHDIWLRWCDQQGMVIPTGDERAAREKLEKEEAQRRAQEAENRAQESENRAQLLAQKLRELGVDPDTI